jgi:hypothetical protein
VSAKWVVVGLLVVRRHVVTDESWAVSSRSWLRRGWAGRLDRRQAVNEILWKLSTGAVWRDLPERDSQMGQLAPAVRCLASDGVPGDPGAGPAARTRADPSTAGGHRAVTDRRRYPLPVRAEP